MMYLEHLQLVASLSLIFSITAVQNKPLYEKNVNCLPCSELKGPCKLLRNYTKPNERPKNEIVLMLNLPYRLDYEGIEDMTGDDRNTGGNYASAAYIAVEDVNRNPYLLKGYELKVLYDPILSDTECIKHKPIRSLLQEINELEPHGYVGYRCNCRTIAKILSSVNRPLISHVLAQYQEKEWLKLLMP